MPGDGVSLVGTSGSHGLPLRGDFMILGEKSHPRHDAAAAPSAALLSLRPGLKVHSLIYLPLSFILHNNPRTSSCGAQAIIFTPWDLATGAACGCHESS